MKKYEGYEETQAFTGDFETLEAGGYVCKIVGVKVEEKPYGHLMRIAIDIAEGNKKDFYNRKYTEAKKNNPDAKWQGMYYQTVRKDDLRFFKGFMTVLENSNNGFKWDWDESKLNGKLFGGIFGEEEYQDHKGEIKKSVKCLQVRSVDKIREGDFEIPALKKLNNDLKSSASGFFPMDSGDDELPF